MTIELTESEWRMVLRKLRECSYPEDEQKLATIANHIYLRLKHLPIPHGAGAGAHSGKGGTQK